MMAAVGVVQDQEQRRPGQATPLTAASHAPYEHLPGSECSREAVGVATSAWQPAAGEAGLERQKQEEGGAKEVSAYCKAQLSNGIMEFSFEEVRAQRYFQLKHTENQGKIRAVREEKEKLQHQVEEQRHLLLQRRSQDMPSAPLDQNKPPAPRFHIFTDSQKDSPAAKPHGICINTDDVFLHPGERELSLKIHFPGGAVPPAENSHTGQPLLAGRWSPSEEALVCVPQNKTLCSSPDNTRDFAGNAKMVSTPHTSSGARRTCPPSAEDLCVPAERYPSPSPPQQEVAFRNKLSPIHEASLEARSMAPGPASLSSQSSHQELLPTPGPAPGPCSPVLRAQLLQQENMGSFQNFHSEPGPVPRMEEGCVVVLGSKVFLLLSKVLDQEEFCVYVSDMDPEHQALLKVERSLVPWDFFILSQLGRRLSPSSPPLISCYVFLDACVTVYSVSRQHRLIDLFEPRVDGRVTREASLLLELLRTFHRCRLVHGAPRPETLLFFSHSPLLVSLDLSSSLDLDLQKDLTSIQQIPAALRFLQQGALEPSASPYQLDLLAAADTVHFLLTGRKMRVVQEESGWTVDGLGGITSRNQIWSKFFKLLLNPDGRTSESVLSELLDHLSDSH